MNFIYINEKEINVLKMMWKIICTCMKKNTLYNINKTQFYVFARSCILGKIMHNFADAKLCIISLKI